MKINFTDFKIQNIKDDSTLIIPVFNKKLDKNGQALDNKLDKNITLAMKHNNFSGDKGEILFINIPNKKSINNVILIGLGKDKNLEEFEISNCGGKVLSLLECKKIKQACFIAEAAGLKLTEKIFTTNFVYGMLLKSYSFNRHYTKNKDKHTLKFEQLEVWSKDSANVKKLFKNFEATSEAVKFTRDLVSEAPNILYPDHYANLIKENLEPLGCKVKILKLAELKKLGMGTLLGVGQGSVRESRVVIMEWNGGKKSEAPVSFIGKGVTFDTGGISLKPPAGMEAMKYDMGGSAAVVGSLYSLAKRKAKVNAVGIVGLVENMPDGNAIRPGDVLTSMSGQTVEVLNTDAEGRLVLCDIMWYCQENYKPKIMIDLATLTGAVIIAIGKEFAGLFANDEKLAEQLTKVGQKTDEKLWRLPLHDVYDKMMDSDIADMRNISNGKGPGSTTAAQFLQRFVTNKTKWAHLDIAGVAWADNSKDLCPKGATGFGVRLLDKLVQEYYE